MQNSDQRPLILLGTNVNLYHQVEMAELNGMKVVGVIDSDYYGNTDTICDVPVIDTERVFDDPERLAHYRENFQFFCAVVGLPEKNPVTMRNYEKRLMLLDLIDQHDLPCVSLVSPHASISSLAKIGKGVFIDHFVTIEAKVELEDYVSVYGYSMINHFTKVGRNTQFHRYSSIGSFCTVGENSHFSPMSRALKAKLKFGKNTWIQQGISIMRGTVENEIVSVDGNNTRRVVLNHYIVEE